MIAGTSTGGIIALGLAFGLRASEIRDFYVERGGLIFPEAGFFGRIFRWVRRWTRYVYDSRALEAELLRIFGDAPLDRAQTRLCIPSFEGIHGEPWIFKTPHHPDYKKDRFATMVHVGLATSAAPTFLRAVSNSGYIMVDGGLWANNPIMNAVVDALACYDIERSQIRILSLGCGETSFQVSPSVATGGLLQWRRAILAAMRAQSLNALGQSYLLVGKNNVVRLDAPEARQPINMDNHRRAVRELPPTARTLVEASGHHIASIFLTKEAEPYSPCPIPSLQH
jgi:patatin-like phospholipase/acyl hydrolase